MHDSLDLDTRILLELCGADAPATPGAATADLVARLRQRLARVRGATRIAQALWVRLDVEAGGLFLEQLAEMMEEQQGHADVLRAALVDLGAGTEARDDEEEALIEQGCLDVVLDLSATLADALRAVVVAHHMNVEGWLSLVDAAIAHEHHALADELREAKNDADEHLDDVRGWLDALTHASRSTRVRMRMHSH